MKPKKEKPAKGKPGRKPKPRDPNVQYVKGKTIPLKGTKGSNGLIGNKNSVGNKGGTGIDSHFKPEYVELAYKYCLLGADQARLAEFFGCHLNTITNWKKDYPDFADAIFRGGVRADAEIAHALYHRAKGYEHPDVEIKVVDKEIVEVPLIKHYPPDTHAAKMWLMNRRPDKWKDATQTEVVVKEVRQVFKIGDQEIEFK